jgi:hypothetical protein
VNRESLLHVCGRRSSINDKQTTSSKQGPAIVPHEEVGSPLIGNGAAPASVVVIAPGNGAANDAANGGDQSGNLAAATPPGKPAAKKLQVFSNSPTFTITAPLTVINSTLRSEPAI